jgi:hypothetical protein
MKRFMSDFDFFITPSHVSRPNNLATRWMSIEWSRAPLVRKGCVRLTNRSSGAAIPYKAL